MLAGLLICRFRHCFALGAVWVEHASLSVLFAVCPNAGLRQGTDQGRPQSRSSAVGRDRVQGASLRSLIRDQAGLSCWTGEQGTERERHVQPAPQRL